MENDIIIRRTTPLDYMDKPWRAEIDLSDKTAGNFWDKTGPLNDQKCKVVAWGNSPEHALTECYIQVGKKACMSAIVPVGQVGPVVG